MCSMSNLFTMVSPGPLKLDIKLSRSSIDICGLTGPFDIDLDQAEGTNKIAEMKEGEVIWQNNLKIV